MPITKFIESSDTEVVYPRITSDPKGYRVQVSQKMYLPGYYTNGIYAEKALDRHLSMKKIKALKSRKKT